MMRIATALALLLTTAAPVGAQHYQLLQTINPDLTGGGTQSGDPGPQFGYALSSHGDTLLIGAPWFVGADSVQQGVVDEFDLDGQQWQFGNRHTGFSQGFNGARCGWSVAVMNRPASQYHKYFGCPYASFLLDGGNPVENGFTRIMARVGSLTYTGLASGESNTDLLGYAVDATYLSDGSPIYAIGAPGGNYVRVGWPGAVTEYDAILTGNVGESFGESVSIAGGGPTCCPVWLAVGAPAWSIGRGKVYVYFYHRNDQEWKLAAQLTAPGTPQPLDTFGRSVIYHTGPNSLDLSDDLLVVGAPVRHTGGDTGLDHRRGTVSVFRQTSPGTFTHQEDVAFQCLIDPTGTCTDRNQNMRFGHALAVDDNGHIWIGAPHFDQAGEPWGGTNAGRVYRARYTPPGGGALFPGWRINMALSPGPLSEDCGQNAVGGPGGRFGWALATVRQGIAAGYPGRGCKLPSSAANPVRRGQVRIYGIPDIIFDDRFEG